MALRESTATERRRQLVGEARLGALESGLAPETDGWFVVNVRDAAWETSPFGSGCFFESETAPFRDLGINVRVLWPGRSRGLYHAESTQEDFLVLAGECLLVVEGQERRLQRWDFVHCPPGTAHAFVATGDGPCVIVMTGARAAEPTFHYPRSELALRHGVGVETETTSPAEAQAQLGGGEWRLERPADWDTLPWVN
jgi:uncharacterized cupin superfamily protein